MLDAENVCQEEVGKEHPGGTMGGKSEKSFKSNEKVGIKKWYMHPG
jgi:hypothetical protein